MVECSKEEFLKYWRLLEKWENHCDNCDLKGYCLHKSYAYHPKRIRKACSGRPLEFFEKLQEMRNGKPLGYFGVKGEAWGWWRELQEEL